MPEHRDRLADDRAPPAWPYPIRGGMPVVAARGDASERSPAVAGAMPARSCGTTLRRRGRDCRNGGRQLLPGEADTLGRQSVHMTRRSTCRLVRHRFGVELLRVTESHPDRVQGAG